MLIDSCELMNWSNIPSSVFKFQTIQWSERFEFIDIKFTFNIYLTTIYGFGIGFGIGFVLWWTWLIWLLYIVWICIAIRRHSVFCTSNINNHVLMYLLCTCFFIFLLLFWLDNLFCLIGCSPSSHKIVFP